MDFKINVQGQTLVPSRSIEKLVDGTRQFTKFKFEFSKEWADMVIFAQFLQSGIAYQVYLNEDNEVYLPVGIKRGFFSLSLRGDGKNGEIATTDAIKIKVRGNVLLVDTEGLNIPESLYSQLVKRVDQAEAKGISDERLQTNIREILPEFSDDTLKIGGMSADSKTVGDEFTKQKERIDQLFEELKTKSNSADTLQKLASLKDLANTKLATTEFNSFVASLQKVLDEHKGAIDLKASTDSLNKSIEDLSKEVSKKALQTDLKALESTVNSNKKRTDADFAELQQVVNTKASEQRAQELEEALDTKASTESVLDLQTDVNKKLEQEDLKDYAKKSELPTKISQLQNDKGYLTEHQSLTDYAKKAELTEATTSLSNALQTVSKNLVTVGNATEIVESASGTEIILEDSAEAPFKELHVYGRSEQFTTTGAQLIRIGDTKIVVNDIEYNVNKDGGFSIKGTALNAGGRLSFGKVFLPFILKAGTYCASYSPKKIDDLVLCVSKYGTSEILASSSNSPVFTLTEDTKILIGFNVKKDITYNTIIYPMLNEGSTPLPYEPYTGGQPSPSPDYPQEIVSVEKPSMEITGKNLFDMSNMIIPELSYVSLVKNNEGFVSYLTNKAPNSSPGSYNYSSGWSGFTLLNLESGNYVLDYSILFTQSKGASSFSKAHVWLASKTLGSKIINKEYTIDYGMKTTVSFPFTISDKIKNNLLLIGFSHNSCTITVDNLQIRRSDAKEGYEPYKEPQIASIPFTLRAIGDIKDELIVRADGSGEFVQRIGELILDGTEKWEGGLYLSNISLYKYYTRIPDIKTNTRNILCNCGIFKTISPTEENCIYVGGSFNFTTYINSIDAFKEKIKQKPLIISFELATPITTPLTPAQVQTILHSNYPTTVVTNDQGAEMEVEYVADAKAYIDNNFKTISDRLTAIEETITK